MADYRTVHTKIWDDPWVHALPDSDHKLLWFYLITNRRASVAGIYLMPFWVIEGETGIQVDVVQAALDRFARDGKIEYDAEIMWVINMRRYQCTTSADLLKKVAKDVALIPDRPIKAHYTEYQEKGTLPTPSGDRPGTRACARAEPNRTEPNRTEPIRTEPCTRKPRAASAPATHSKTQQLIDHYHDEYLRLFKRKPHITGAKEGANFKRILGGDDPAYLCAVLTFYLESEEPFWVQAEHSLDLFFKQIDQVIAKYEKSKAKEERQADYDRPHKPGVYRTAADLLPPEATPEERAAADTGRERTRREMMRLNDSLAEKGRNINA